MSRFWLKTIPALSLLTTLAAAQPQATTRPVSGPELLDAVHACVQENFYDPTLRGLDWDGLGAAYRARIATLDAPGAQARLVNELLGHLRASHTELLTPQDERFYHLADIFWGPDSAFASEFGPGARTSYAGIGVFLRQLDGKTFIKAVWHGFPAEQAGLQAGDQLLAADGGPFEPVGSFAGRIGREVTLRVQSAPDPGSARDVQVRPVRIQPGTAFLDAQARSCRIMQRDGVGVGYIHIWSYAGLRYHELLVQAASGPELSGADALVIDLREGLGGASAEYLNFFNRSVPLTQMVLRGGTAHAGDRQWRKPVALLVNEGTTSGKEIFAYGFQKYRLGPVIGTRTAGAVLGGRGFPMPGGNLLYLAVADVLVDGLRLEGIGVTPDIEVPFDFRYSAGRDPQLERAVQIMAAAAQAGGT